MHTLFKPDWQTIWQDYTMPESASVYTKAEVVSLILDLAGYHRGRAGLIGLRLLGPCCGDGAFLREIVSRLPE